MARVTIGNRLEALVGSAHLDSRDREFASDLLAHYRKKGSLTSGRRHWLTKLEEKAASRKANPPKVDTETLSRIDALLAKDMLAWGRDMLVSQRDWVSSGRALTERQVRAIERVEYDTREVENFEFTDADRVSMATLAEYYGTTGYYSRFVRDFRENPNYVPAPHFWKKLTNNKYARMVLAESQKNYFEGGDEVKMRSNAAVRKTYGRSMAGRLGFVLQDHGVTSAVQGGKCYLVLFAGEAAPRKVEARYLMKNKG